MTAYRTIGAGTQELFYREAGDPAVSRKLARHAWRRHPPSTDAPAWDDVPDVLALDRLGERERLTALSAAIDELSERQREVFVAIALNDVPIDVLALKLGTNRNAIYKNLFDAKRNLRAKLAAAGHPVSSTRRRPSTPLAVEDD